MDLARDLTRWTSAVFKAWYGWVGASATAGVVGFGQGMGWWESPGRQTYFALLVAGLLVSLFEAWRKEHQSAEEAIKAARNQEPDFALNIENCIWSFDQGTNQTVFVLSTFILNKGAPSVALSWSAQYQFADSNEKMVGFYLRDEGYTITIGNQELKLTNDNLLIPQVLTKRLEKGEAKLGRVIFTLSGNRVAQIETHNFVITTTCFDYRGRPYSAEYRPTTTPLSTVMMYPGEQLRTILPVPIPSAVQTAEDKK